MPDPVESSARSPSTPRQRVVFWLVVALAATALANVAMFAFLRARGEPEDQAVQGIGLSLTPKLLDPTGIDSWKPMAAAYERNQKYPGEMYWIFLKKGLRFQYPPSALLVMKFIPLPLTIPFRETLAKPSLAAVLITILCAFGIVASTPRTSDRSRRTDAVFALCSASLVAALGLTYYPLVKGHNLGQIQVYLGASVAAALLARATGLKVLSGAFVGLCCLIKPQYGLLLLWAALRREWRFAAGLLAVLITGFAISLHEFGLHNHLQYLEVLRILSRQGESFWPNQSVNGVLHRLLGNGEPVKWLPRDLPPYHPVVYYATLITSALFVAAALFVPTAAKYRGTALDLATVLVAATLASPIAWEHHYGAFFPVFMLALPAFTQGGLRPWPLVLGYSFLSVELLRPELIFVSPLRSLLGAHIFVGALLFLGGLLKLRAAR